MVGTRTRSLAFGDGGKPLQPAHAGFAEAFCIGHDVGLRHRHEIRGTEEVADLDLVLQCLLRKRTDLAGQNILLFVVELHLPSVDLRAGILHGLAPFGEFAALKVRERTAGQRASANDPQRLELARGSVARTICSISAAAKSSVSRPTILAGANTPHHAVDLEIRR